MGAKQVRQNLGIISEIDVDVALDHAGAVALEHIICTKGGWEPPGGIGLPQIVLTVHMVHLVGRQRVHGETVQIPYHSAMVIGALASNYWRSRKNPIVRTEESWSHPSEGLMKINVDAAYSEEEGRGSCVMIITDSTGK
jgi:hypothetical protein